MRRFFLGKRKPIYCSLSTAIRRYLVFNLNALFRCLDRASHNIPRPRPWRRFLRSAPGVNLKTSAYLHCLHPLMPHCLAGFLWNAKISFSFRVFYFGADRQWACFHIWDFGKPQNPMATQQQHHHRARHKSFRNEKRHEQKLVGKEKRKN